MTATGAEGEEEMAVAAKAEEVPTVAAVAATTIHPLGMLRAKIREKIVAAEEEEQVSGKVRRAILVLRIRTRL